MNGMEEGEGGERERLLGWEERKILERKANALPFCMEWGQEKYMSHTIVTLLLVSFATSFFPEENCDDKEIGVQMFLQLYCGLETDFDEMVSRSQITPYTFMRIQMEYCHLYCSELLGQRM